MIKFILSAIILVVHCLLAVIILPIEWVVGKINKRAKDISCLRMVQFSFNLIVKISGIELTVIGEENVPKDQPVLYIGNHRSYFDVIITYARVPDLCGYIAKKEFAKVPFLYNWMKALYCLFLDRSNPKEGLKTILQGVEYIKQGISICIFPEGTRSRLPGNEMLPFKEGSFKIAERTGCPIIPMAITNSAEIFENHFPLVKKCHVILEYGEPIMTSDLTRQEKKALGRNTRDIIQGMLDEHQKML